jgi:hypothetical protein
MMLVGQLVAYCTVMVSRTVLTVLRVRWWHHYKGPLVQTVGVALLLCGRKKGACSTVTFGGADARCDTQVLVSQRLGRAVLLCHVHLFHWMWCDVDMVMVIV